MVELEFYGTNWDFMGIKKINHNNPNNNNYYRRRNASTITSTRVQILGKNKIV